MLAFSRALAAGYDEIEADVWMTADGHHVIYHDETVSKTRSIGPYAGRKIWTLTWAQIRTIRSDGQPIPTESDLLRLIARSKNKHARLRLEAKSPVGQSDAEARAWAKAFAVEVVNSGLAGRTIMQDFNWTGLTGFRAASPRLRYSALITNPTSADIDRAAALGAYDVSYAAEYTSSSLNAYVAGKHMVPTVWGVDPTPGSPKRLSAQQSSDAVSLFARAVSDGAKVVITNYPDLLANRAAPTP